mmetsp:Transcript_122549/g.392192  ORF Transcript_122549/g.392192 Transcript_122549/m.392192 type:complete len:136 (+) Transcript_122549:73-480(+)
MEGRTLACVWVPLGFQAASGVCGMNMSPRSRVSVSQVLLSSPGVDTTFPLNLRAFYRKDLTVHSTETMQYDVVGYASCLAELLPGFQSGALVPPPTCEHVFPLQATHEAFAKVKGGAAERVVVSPAATPVFCRIP